MKNEPSVLSVELVTVTPPSSSCDVIRDYVVVMAYDRMREEDGGDNASIMQRLRKFAGMTARGACPDMFLEEEPTPTWTVNYEPFGAAMTLKVRYEIRPKAKFISPEAAADATIEDLSAMQPPAPAGPPMTVTAPANPWATRINYLTKEFRDGLRAGFWNTYTGSPQEGSRPALTKEGQRIPDDPTRAAVALELQRISASRLADARLELWKAARRELAKRKEWLRCAEHDKALSVYEVEDFVIRMRCTEPGCIETRCLTMDTPKRLRGFVASVFDIGPEHGGTRA